MNMDLWGFTHINSCVTYALELSWNAIRTQRSYIFRCMTITMCVFPASNFWVCNTLMWKLSWIGAGAAAPLLVLHPLLLLLLLLPLLLLLVEMEVAVEEGVVSSFLCI